MAEININPQKSIRNNLRHDPLTRPINGYKVMTIVDEERLRTKHLNTDELYSIDRLLVLRNLARKELSQLNEVLPSPTIVKIETILQNLIDTVENLER